MTDLSRIPTDQLQAMLAQSQSSKASPSISNPQAAPDLSKIPTEQLQAMLKTSAQPQAAAKEDSQGVLGKVYAAASGLSTGALEGIESLGGVANNILKAGAKAIYGKDSDVEQGLTMAGKLGSQGIGKVKELVAPGPGFAQQAVQENPNTYGVAGAVGNLGALIGSGNAITKPLTTLASPLVAMAPNALKTPVIAGALSQGALGSVVGAASNEQNPMEGALTGLATGAILGAAGGALGQKLQRGGDIINFETKNIADAGINPTSIESITRIKKALKDNGVDFSNQNLKQVISHKIQEQIDSVSPLNMTNKAPSRIIADLANTNFKKVARELKEKFLPFRNSLQEFKAPLYQNAISKVDPNLLPKTQISAKPTFNDMWTYREQLDGTINYTKARIAMKKASQAEKDNIIPLKNLRNAVADDMLNAAQAMGQKEAFQNLQAKYQNEYLPFKAFRTPSGKVADERDTIDAMRKLNQMFKARNVDINRLNDISKSLGPDGNELVGKAMIQQIYRNSLDNKGNVNPTEYFSQLKKYNASGLSQEIWGLKTRQAAAGIGKILDGADEVLKTGTPQDLTSFYDKLPSLISSWPGRQILSIIGSSKTPQTVARTLIQQLLTGATANVLASPPVSTDQE